jgi:hypothetical protein
LVIAIACSVRFVAMHYKYHWQDLPEPYVYGVYCIYNIIGREITKYKDTVTYDINTQFCPSFAIC